MEIAEKLKPEFDDLVNKAEEIWIACATVSRKAYTPFINALKKRGVKPTFVIGLNLLIEPYLLENVLLRHQKREWINCVIYRRAFFHPKMYLFKSGERFIAFIGSGNFTMGGIHNHIELNVKVEDQTFCKSVLAWFNGIYNQSEPLNQEVIDLYKKKFERIRYRQKEIEKEISSLIEERFFDHTQIDYTNQYFKREHFEAFHPDKAEENYKTDRDAVKELLLQIHDDIYDKSLRILNIYPHHSGRNHFVSNTYHFRKGSKIMGIWLHYGPHQSEMGSETDSTKFMKLQIILHYSNVGIWLRVGRNGGSRDVRESFATAMKEEEFRRKFYNLMRSLGDEYWVEIGDDIRYIFSFDSPEDLWGFTLKDNWRDKYFIIGRTYDPDSPDLSIDHIKEKIKDEFFKLHPLYQLFERLNQKRLISH